MGRDHVPFLGFNNSRVASVLLHLVEIGQVPACAIEKETEELLKYFLNRDAFSALSQSCKIGHQQSCNDLNVFQIPDKEAQACTSSDPLVSRFDLVNSAFAFVLFFVSLGHMTLHFLGDMFCLSLLLYKAKYIRTLPKCGGLFM